MRRTASIAGVVLLVVVDVVLVVLAWNHVNSGDPGSSVIEDVADTATAATDPTSSDPTPSEATPSGTSGSDADPATAYAAAVVAGELLARAPVGSCSQDATTSVEVSGDGGASFDELDTPLTSVTKLAATSASELVAVGTDEQCEVAAVSSTDGGESWESMAVEDAGWSVVGEAQLVSPGGELGDIGCIPVDVSGVTPEDAVVLCEDGLVLRTDNAGSFWGAQTTLPVATDVAFYSASEGYAVVERGGCPALVRATTDGGASWVDVQCISAQGAVGLAADEDVVALLAADEVYRSEDRGENWQVR